MIIKREQINFESLRAEREEFEKLYLCASDKLALAFTQNGILSETEDFYRWQHIHHIIEAFGESQ